ncbi:MAG: 2-acyl-glycerophospho-ethanolamine acyltransferase, partial [Lentisphaerae bacterium]
MKRILYLFLELLLRLRYRIRKHHWQEIKRPRQGRGVLFLPNHPAEIDPVILMLILRQKFDPSPVVVEDFYYTPGIHFIMKWLRAYPVPSITGKSSTWARERWEQSLSGIVESLKAGHDVLMYPAGRLMRDEVENLRGASALFQILQQMPEVDICLIRTRGLLGSSFSWLRQRKRPDFVKTALFGIKALLLNGIFFMPRRRVEIEFVLNPPEFPARAPDKETLNRWLDNWYNAPEPEKFDPGSYG